MAGKGGLAEQVRTGLVARPRLTVIKTKKHSDPLDEVWVNKPLRKHVSEFGAVFAIILLTIAGIKLYRYSLYTTPLYFILGAVIFLVLGYRLPRLLLPVWRGWMKFAMVLGLIMTTLIIGIAWTLMLVPIALLLKLFGVKSMDLSYGGAAVTYWEERDPKLNDFKLLERQY